MNNHFEHFKHYKRASRLRTHRILRHDLGYWLHLAGGCRHLGQKYVENLEGSLRWKPEHFKHLEHMHNYDTLNTLNSLHLNSKDQQYKYCYTIHRNNTIYTATHSTIIIYYSPKTDSLPHKIEQATQFEHLTITLLHTLLHFIS